MTITRKRFVRLVTQAIAGTKGLRKTQKEKLLNTAEEMKCFLVGDWVDEETGCGCVVGTAYGGAPNGGPLWAAGADIDRAICHARPDVEDEAREAAWSDPTILKIRG